MVAVSASAAFVAIAALVWHAPSMSVPLLDRYGSCIFSEQEARVTRLVMDLWSPISVIALALVAAALLIHRRQAQSALLVFAAPIIAVGASEATKPLVGRFYAGNASFPSVHAAASCALVVSLAIAASRSSRSSRIWLVPLGALAVGLTILLDIQMVRTCAHRPNDVAGGALLGLTCTGVGVL